MVIESVEADMAEEKGARKHAFFLSYIDLLRVNMPQIHLQYCKNNHNFCSIVGKYMLVASKCRRTSYHHILYNIYITWL